MEALVTVKTLVAELKVKFVDVAIGLVPLPNNISVAVTAVEPVPPLLTGRIPEVIAEASMAMEVGVTAVTLP